MFLIGPRQNVQKIVKERRKERREKERQRKIERFRNFENKGKIFGVKIIALPSYSFKFIGNDLGSENNLEKLES